MPWNNLISKRESVSCPNLVRRQNIKNTSHLLLVLCATRGLEHFSRHFLLDINKDTSLLNGVEWVRCLFLFPLVLGKYSCHMQNLIFLCSLDNLLQKNAIVFFFENKISKWRSFEKKVFFFFTYFSHFLVTREKLQKFLQHISNSHTYIYFSHPIDFFCLTNFEKKNTNLSGMVSIRCDSWCWFLFAPFWNNQ